MPKMDLSKYGIKNVKEVLYNPSYEVLYNEETKPGLEGYEKGKVTELGAVNVMTGIYTGRSPRTSTLSWTRTRRTPYGGLPTSTRMTTTLFQRRTGKSSGSSHRSSSPASVFS